MVGVLRNSGFKSPQPKRQSFEPATQIEEEDDDLGLDLDKLPKATQAALESVAKKILQQQQEEQQEQRHQGQQQQQQQQQQQDLKNPPLPHPLLQEKQNSNNNNNTQACLEERVIELESKLATLSLLLHEQQAQINQQNIHRGHNAILRSISPQMGGMMTPPDSPPSPLDIGDATNLDDMTRAVPPLDSPAAPQSRYRRDAHNRRRNLSFKLLYQQSEFPQPHEVYSDEEGRIATDEDEVEGENGVFTLQTTTTTTTNTTKSGTTRKSSTADIATSSSDKSSTRKKAPGTVSSSGDTIQDPPPDYFDKLSESMTQNNSTLSEEQKKVTNDKPSVSSPSPPLLPHSMPLLDDPTQPSDAAGSVVEPHTIGLKKRENSTTPLVVGVDETAKSSDATARTIPTAATTTTATTATPPNANTTTTTTTTTVTPTNATGTTTSTPSEFFITPNLLHRSSSIVSVDGNNSKSTLRLKWLDYLNSFQETNYDVDKQMEEFVMVPGAVEGLLSFGFWICVDSFLDCLTILPIRAAWSCVLLQRYVVLKATLHRHTPVPNGPYRFHRRHSYQLIQVGIIYTVYKYALTPVSIGKLYHWIRGQSMIKLYVLIAIVEVFDRLMCSLGQDCLDSLYWNTTRRPGSSRWIVAVIVVLVYAMVHSFLLFVHVATLNVAMNSADQALLTLLISGNFAEIKSTVFKKYNKVTLFKITASDICERFKLALFLGLVLVLNVCQGMDEKMFLSYCQMCGIVWCAEWLSDWIKHSFITKFNYISSNIYPQYALLLAGDVTGIGHEGVNLDHSHSVVKRIGFAQIPLVCVMARYIREAAKYATSDWHDGDGTAGDSRSGGPPPQWMVALGVIAFWFVLLLGKISLGNLLHSISEKKLKSAPELSKSSTTISMSSGSAKKKN